MQDVLLLTCWLLQRLCMATDDSTFQSLPNPQTVTQLPCMQHWHRGTLAPVTCSPGRPHEQRHRRHAPRGCCRLLYDPRRVQGCQARVG